MTENVPGTPARTDFVSVTALEPMAHVASVTRSSAFYAKLGFTVGNIHTPHGAAEPAWAWLRSGGAHLMVAQASGTVDPGVQAVLFYLYCADVAAYRQPLLAAGVETGPIASPFYAHRGEFRVTDPDGYVLMVTHAG